MCEKQGQGPTSEKRSRMFLGWSEEASRWRNIIYYGLPVYDTRTYSWGYDTPFAYTVIEAARVPEAETKSEEGACMEMGNVKATGAID